MFNVPVEGGLCYVCRGGLQRIKRDEEDMKAFLVGKAYHWSYYDQALPCAKPGERKRPDFVLVFGDYIIIIEVDEHYHQRYNVPCELKRIELIHSAAGLPMILIRFHPDSRKFGALDGVIKEAIKTEGQKAKESPFGVHLAFIGYPAERIHQMQEEMEKDVQQFYPYDTYM
jgi:hypothetical protein